MLASVACFLLIALSQAIYVRQVHNTSNSSHASGIASGMYAMHGNLTQSPIPLADYYHNHNTGRGIWKWNNALAVYQHFFTEFIGQPVKLAEIGVQSGGSIYMWKAALGTQCYIYGLDINPACQQFADASTTISIGNQGDVNMWNHFFTHVTPNLDILIDDGSHEAPHMVTTLSQVFPRLNPGGFIAIEDIHGRHYTQSFFWPAAKDIFNWHAQGLVHSVHVYPFLMVVKKSRLGVQPTIPQAAVVVNDFPGLWASLGPYAGKAISVQNPSWGSFLAEGALRTIFEQLAPLHDYNMQSYPPGCATTAAPICTAGIVNSNAQATMLGVDIYHNQLIVWSAAQPPIIQAVRKGTDWLPY